MDNFVWKNEVIKTHNLINYGDAKSARFFVDLKLPKSKCQHLVDSVSSMFLESKIYFVTDWILENAITRGLPSLKKVKPQINKSMCGKRLFILTEAKSILCDFYEKGGLIHFTCALIIDGDTVCMYEWGLFDKHKNTECRFIEIGSAFEKTFDEGELTNAATLLTIFYLNEFEKTRN